MDTCPFRIRTSLVFCCSVGQGPGGTEDREAPMAMRARGDGATMATYLRPPVTGIAAGPGSHYVGVH